MPAPERYRLTVAGGKRIDQGTSVAMLAIKGADLARRGYVAFIKNAQGSTAELRRGPDGIEVTYRRAPQDLTDITGGEFDPGWIETIRTALVNAT